MAILVGFLVNFIEEGIFGGPYYSVSLLIFTSTQYAVCSNVLTALDKGAGNPNDTRNDLSSRVWGVSIYV